MVATQGMNDPSFMQKAFDYTDANGKKINGERGLPLGEPGRLMNGFMACSSMAWPRTR